MANIDIVARLQLRAEQFSSETGARFAEMKTRAQSSAAEVRNAFTSSFAQVQKLAQQASVVPRNTSGSLDLSSEIADLQKSATASDQRAAALREMSIAQTAAAASGRADAEALRLEADAAAVGALASERDAEALRSRIGALKAVQVELNRSASATKIVNEQAERYVVSAGQQRASTMMLGQQVQDFTVQVVSGTSPATAFAQQVGQAGFALQGMGGKLASVGAFLGTGWGTAVLVGLTVLTPLVGKMLEHNNLLDDALDKLKKDAAQTDIDRQAKERFKTSVEGVSQAINEQRDAQLKSIETAKSAAEQDNITANRNLERQIAIRRTTALLLEQAVAEFKASQSIINQSGGAAQYVYAQRLDAAEKAAKAARDQLAATEKNVERSRFDLAAEQAKRETDPIAKINKLYDNQIIALKVIKNQQIDNGAVVGAATKRELAGIEARRQAAIKAQQESDRAAQSAARAGPLTNFLSPVSGRVTGTFGESRPGHTHAGVDYAVPVGTPVRAPAAGTVDVAGPRSGYGNAIYINFGGGTSGRFGHLSKFNVKPGDTVNAGDVIGYSGGAPGAEGSGRSTGAHLHYEVRRNGRAVDPRKGAFKTDAGSAGDDAQRVADRIAKANEQAANKADEASRAIAGINAQWDEQPRLIDRAAIESAKLTDIIKDYDGKPDAASQAIVANAKTALQTIQAGMTRPFDDYVKSQREAVGVQQLALHGREAEAAALSVALGIQRQMGPLDQAQLATIVQIERHQQAIADAIEDQRRVVGLYSGAVGNLQQRFEGFLDGLRTKPGAALQDLVGGFVDEFSQLQNSLLSEQLFGGMQREMERYVAQRMGGTTPSDMLKEQIGDAGTVLDRHTDDVGGALDDMVKSLRGAIDRINGLDPRAVSAAGAKAVGANLGGSTMTPISDLLTSGLKIDIAPLDTGAANDNDVVVTARKDMIDALKGNTTAQMTAADFFNHAGQDMAGRLEKITGIKIPEALKNSLGTALQGASNGQLGGSVFASITGGKNNALASSIGGVLGQEAGKAMSKPIGDLIGGTLGKTLGGAAGPLGAIAGGILGNVIGGLFKKSTQASSTITFGADGLGAGAAVGNGTAEKAAASASANSVVGSINRIAEALGGTVTGAGSVSIGYRPNHKAGAYRVDTSGTGKLTGGTILAFATEEEAVRAAIAEALKDGVVGGISAASKRILAAGGDLEKAITKASLIEAVPKDLKAMLDPVGAAIDELNRKFQQTVDALKEGGASAEQMAQAEQLYNLQLDQTKASAQSASSSLKDFLTALKVGSNSPYSLRDQEATAKAGLQPYLDQINAGQAIDQSKYQSAAQTFLDVERQLYGSTQNYFDALDQVQASTNKAISTIDNVKPITTAVESPFAKATADSAAATADGVQTGNEIAAQSSDLLATMVQQQAELITVLKNGTSGDFIGSLRGFAA